jgi:hypothetical protein
MTKADQAQLLAAARAEVDDFHVFFDDWFTGACPRTEELLEARLADRLGQDFQLIYPGGGVIDRAGLIDGVRQSYGKSPGYKTQIRDVRLRPMEANGYLLVNYEEWQKNAANSTPPNNGRLSSVVFRIVSHDPIKLEWLHLHETWLPADVMAADPFDF